MAKGSAASTPLQPKGRKMLLPSVGSMSRANFAKSKWDRAPIQKTSRIARASRVMKTVAISRPPKPPAAMPKFQPKKSPEMTAPTPSAQSEPTRA